MSSAVARPKDWTEQSIAPRVQPGRPHWLALANRLRELELTYDAEKRILWQYMMPDGRPSFTHGLISEISATLDLVENVCADAEDPPISYLVLGSHLPGIFNLGGNLPLFMELIERQDRDTLRRYAHACVNEQYRWAANHNLPVCTIALVQGDALGGGFEAALAHNVIIAERSAKFGLPEVLFNLFPGMGAYSFLSRRLDAARAERMILSGRIYSAEELYELGLVERIAEDGQGRDAVYDFIRERQRSRSAWQAVVGARRIVNPITRQELIDVTNLWVETAMTLSSADLRRMKHLATAQDRRLAKTWAD
ncbi:MAG: crotonase/enoyl-CoA hydratase family protein [Rhodospirillales bacterium]